MWRTAAGQAYRLRQFNEQAQAEYVMYNDLTGATHLLGEAAVHLIQVLRCGPATTAALCEALAVSLDCPRDAQLDADTAGLLAQLAGFFLIESIP